MTLWPLLQIVFLFTVGIAILRFGIKHHDYCLRRADWPAIDGEFYSCELKEEKDEDGNDADWMEVKYRWFLAGREYQARRSARFEGRTPASTQMIYRELLSSMKVLVRYDPANPATAFLDRDLKDVSSNPIKQPLIVLGVAWLVVLCLFCWEYFSGRM